MQNKLQQAIEELQAQLAGREASMAELSQMVRLQLRAQHWQEAVRWAEQALQLDARTPECHRLLSEALLGLGMPQESARRLREAIALFPKNPALQAQMALVQLELGDVDAAWAAMQLPLERQLDLPWVHRAHAMVLERLGRLPEACEAMDKALAGAPKNSQWLEQRAALQARLDGAGDTVAAPPTQPEPPAAEPLQPQEVPAAEVQPSVPHEELAAEEIPEVRAAPVEQDQAAEVQASTAGETAALALEPAAEAVMEAEPEAEASAEAAGEAVAVSSALPPPQRPGPALPSAKMIMVPRRDPYPRRSGGWLSRLWQRLLG